MHRVLAILLPALLLAACSGGSSLASGDTATPEAQALPASAPELKQRAVACMRAQDLPCAEAAWSAYVKLRPTDDKGVANLGFVFNAEGKDEQAIMQFERVISQGEGAYDLFGMYADSLAKVGRVDEAIDWSYKTLKLVPSLVDVRGNLAKLLVLKQRQYEALALLAEFDQHLESLGHPAHFLGQRMAIQSLLRNPDHPQLSEMDALRLVKLGNGFLAPVTIGDSGTVAFVVDTGASSVVLNDAFLAQSKAKYAVTHSHATARVADGSVVRAQEIVLDHLSVGSFALDNVKAFVCSTCQLLLGDNVISQFDMNTTQVQGVDVLTLSRRKGT